MKTVEGIGSYCSHVASSHCTLICNGELYLEEAIAASGEVATVVGSVFQSPSLASSPPENKIPLLESQYVLLTISLCPPFKTWQSWSESALTCRMLMLPLVKPIKSCDKFACKERVPSLSIMLCLQFLLARSRYQIEAPRVRLILAIDTVVQSQAQSRITNASDIAKMMDRIRVIAVPQRQCFHMT